MPGTKQTCSHEGPSFPHPLPSFTFPSGCAASARDSQGCTQIAWLQMHYFILSSTDHVASGIWAAGGDLALNSGRSASEQGSEQQAVLGALQFIAVPRLSVGKLPSSCTHGLWWKGVLPQVFISHLERYVFLHRVAVKRPNKQKKKSRRKALIWNCISMIFLEVISWVFLVLCETWYFRWVWDFRESWEWKSRKTWVGGDLWSQPPAQLKRRVILGFTPNQISRNKRHN